MSFNQEELLRRLTWSDFMERRDPHALQIGPKILGIGSPVVIVPNHGYNGNVRGWLLDEIHGNYKGEKTSQGYTIVATSESALKTRTGATYKINPDDRFYAQRENIESDT